MSQTTTEAGIAQNPVLSVRALKDVVHLYIGQEARIWNTVTGEWSNWRKLSFTDCNLIVTHDAKAQLKLKDPLKMPFDEYVEIEKIYGNEDDGSTSTGIISKACNVRRLYLTTYAERFFEVAKRGYDLFGLLDNGYAVLA